MFCKSAEFDGILDLELCHAPLRLEVAIEERPQKRQSNLLIRLNSLRCFVLRRRLQCYRRVLIAEFVRGARGRESGVEVGGGVGEGDGFEGLGQLKDVDGFLIGRAGQIMRRTMKQYVVDVGLFAATSEFLEEFSAFGAEDADDGAFARGSGQELAVIIEGDLSETFGVCFEQTCCFLV